MKKNIHTDLMEALLMLACISLVLTGTSEFDDVMLKRVLIGALSTVSVLLAWLRIKGGRRQTSSDEEEFRN